MLDNFFITISRQYLKKIIYRIVFLNTRFLQIDLYLNKGGLKNENLLEKIHYQLRYRYII